eukprot:CAMPEP_0180578848 /NCGR_PEP_ID=MMETSP1037_2-20121125/12678_1 /TAXON_ID=632150 /ORGANISM="Azadinium spinosum, Strain 3D9" /LENGTH=36 /DNA_ID= /DNA_START= /DNA_END= /DNA_ORIENTATION=
MSDTARRRLRRSSDMAIEEDKAALKKPQKLEPKWLE